MDSDIKKYFEARVKPNGDGDCTIWTGTYFSCGYGRLKVKYKIYYAHRIAYELFYGPFDANLDVLHECDNPACVNPNHLFLGTHVDNMKDKQKKGRALQIVTRKEVLEMLDLYRSGLFNVRTIALKYGISRQGLNGHIRRNGGFH